MSFFTKIIKHFFDSLSVKICKKYVNILISLQTLLKVTRQLSRDLMRLLETNPNVKDSMLLRRAIAWRLPSYTTATQFLRLLWASSSGHFYLLHEDSLLIHSHCVSNIQDTLDFRNLSLYKKTAELLKVAVLSNPNSFQLLCHTKVLPMFLSDVLLLNPNHPLRMATAEQFLLIFISTDRKRRIFQKVRILLFKLVNDSIIERYASMANEIFYLLCQMMKYDEEVHITGMVLDHEVQWLKNVTSFHPVPLEGHLKLTETLINCVNLDRKVQIGSKSGENLIEILLGKFLFPASKVMRNINSGASTLDISLIPLCNTVSSRSAGFSLLKALCNGCTPNYELMSKELDSLFFSGKYNKKFFSQCLVNYTHTNFR